MLSYIDDFKVMAVGAFVIIGLAFFLKEVDLTSIEAHGH